MSGIPWFLAGLAVGAIIVYLLYQRWHRTSQQEIVTLKTQLQERERAEEDQKKLLAEADEGRKQERSQLLQNFQEFWGSKFRELASEALEEKRALLSREGRNVLDGVVTPLKDQMKNYQERLETIHSESQKGTTSMKTHIEQLVKTTQGISEDAKNLTQALQGTSQVRGNWGEMVLQKMLEESGLREGQEYAMQRSMQDEEGGRLRPDVILHLPGERDIVIDAKVSLRDWERAVAAEDEQERQAALADHVRALRSHVKEQGKRSYQDLPGLRTLDFVFLFIPIEPAFMAALQQAPDLYQDAYEKRIVLSSPTTLFAILRVVENLWRMERQNRNAAEIAKEGGKLYDKVAGFLETFNKIQKQLQQALSTWDTAERQLSEGRGNLLSRAENMRKLGARVSKELPSEKLAFDEEGDTSDNNSAHRVENAGVAAKPGADD